MQNVKSEKSEGGGSTWLEKNEKQLSWLTIKDNKVVLTRKSIEGENDSKEEKLDEEKGKEGATTRDPNQNGVDGETTE
jgi:hypothetical protein